MNKTFKIIFSLLISVILSLAAFAQSTDGINAKPIDSVKLLDSDVKNFINNFISIADQMDSSGEEPDIDNNVFTVEEVINAMSKLKSLPKVLEENGITGNNNVAKYVVMIYGSVYFILENQIKSNPELEKQFKAQGLDPMASVELYKKQIASSDWAVMAKYKRLIVEKLSEEFN